MTMPVPQNEVHGTYIYKKRKNGPQARRVLIALRRTPEKSPTSDKRTLLKAHVSCKLPTHVVETKTTLNSREKLQKCTSMQQTTEHKNPSGFGVRRDKRFDEPPATRYTARRLGAHFASELDGGR